MANRNLCQKLFTDDEPNLTMRNKELYDQHCCDIQDPTVTSSFGVEQICLLKDQQYFNVCENYAVDIMYDILEYVGQLELKLLFGYLSDKKKNHIQI